MKLTLLAVLVLVTVSLFSAETTPMQAYYEDANPVTFQKAWIYLNEALTKDPSKMSIQVQMASLSAMESDRLVRDILPKADELDTGGKFQFANLLMSLGTYEPAIRLYQKLNEETPAWSCPWRHKGTCLYELKQYDKAEESLLKAVETNKEHYDAYIWLAKTQYELKKYKIALQNLETALTLNPVAEQNNDEVLSEDSISALHQKLLKKAGKK